MHLDAPAHHRTMGLVMLTALFAPAPQEPWFLSAVGLFVAALVNLVILGLVIWWMVRVVRAVEATAKAQVWMMEQQQAARAEAARAKPIDRPSPTRNILGCLALVFAIAPFTGCDDDSDPQEEGEGDGEGEGGDDEGAEPNGETRERACLRIVTCEQSDAPDFCDDERSEAAHELADEAKTTCGSAPADDAQAAAWGECIAEQCGCSGVDPMTGAQVCE